MCINLLLDVRVRRSYGHLVPQDVDGVFEIFNCEVRGFSLLGPVFSPLCSSMRDRALFGFLPLSLGPQAVFGDRNLLGVVRKVSGAALLWSIFILQRFSQVSVVKASVCLLRGATLLVILDSTIKIGG